MNRDSVLSVYSDARTEYTKQLCVFLVPAYFQFFVDLLEKAKQAMVNEPKRALWQFQTYLNDIHDWNMERVRHEIQHIHTNCGCDYMEDLLTAVFIAHTKVLTAIRLSSNNKKVEINIPKVDHFLFKVLCETSKLLWSSTYLFRDGIPGIEKQQNYRTIETILNEGILQAVRSLVPVKSILKDFVSQDTKEDSDEEDVQEEKKEELAVPPEIALPTEEVLPPKEELLAAKEEVKQEPLMHTEPSFIESIQESLTNALAPSPALVPQVPPVSPSSQVIVIDDKPKVSFGPFNSLFSSESSDDSDMIQEADEDESKEEISPVLEIMDEAGTSLSDGVDFDSLDAGGSSESLDMDEYETLS
jgi:hypothetical protein